MIAHVHRFVLPAAYSLLPPQMNSPAASAMLLSIGLQESRFLHRLQIGGPAKSLFQFERGGGVVGVLTHPKTGELARHALDALRYSRDSSSAAVHGYMADNDTLAAVFARLLLWTVPGRLPREGEADYAWQTYIDGWRPGRPHRSSWNAFYRQAWMRVKEQDTV
ncbi:MAG: hypothetical protein M3Q55_02620 [Acidobacteriota bacterium]|nr:hypothetical protein [Acidobacteriota bacterium]